MTRSELVDRVAARRGLTRAQARRVVDAVLGGIADGLCEGRRVELRGLGTFRPRHHAGYVGRNPRTGARVAVKAKVLTAFRASAVLLARLDPATKEG